MKTNYFEAQKQWQRICLFEVQWKKNVYKTVILNKMSIQLISSKAGKQLIRVQVLYFTRRMAISIVAKKNMYMLKTATTQTKSILID